MKYFFGLMLAVSTMLTYAQKIPLACQVDAAAGLKWEGGKWNTRSFTEDKFLLVLADKTLTTDSVAKAFKGRPSNTKCDATWGELIFCNDGLGTSLVFSTKTNKGGISKLFGTTMDGGDYKDTVTAHAFTCTPF